MYTSIHIRSFRALDDVKLDGLKRINLFVGKNNVGKTSLLEAIILLGGATQPSLAMRLGQLRGQSIDRSRPEPDPIWRSLFARFDPAKTIEIVGQRAGEAATRRLAITAGAARSEYYGVPDEVAVALPAEERAVRQLELRYHDASGGQTESAAWIDGKTGQIVSSMDQRDDVVRSIFLPARSLSALTAETEQFGHLLKTKREGEVLEALRLIEPSLKLLTVVPEAGTSTVYADVGLPGLAPLLVCGEGVVRMFSIAVMVTAARGGVLLIDEIDNGLHYSVMENFWKHLGIVAQKNDVQIFATTHNDELLRSALAAFGEGYEDLGLYRLDRRDDGIKAVRYSAEALRAVAESGFEVRG